MLLQLKQLAVTLSESGLHHCPSHLSVVGPPVDSDQWTALTSALIATPAAMHAEYARDVTRKTSAIQAVAKPVCSKRSKCPLLSLPLPADCRRTSKL